MIFIRIPDETINLYDDPRYRAVRDTLEELLLKERDRWEDNPDNRFTSDVLGGMNANGRHTHETGGKEVYAGMTANFSSFRKKELINVSDGMKLGFVDDIMFDSESAEVQDACGLREGRSCSAFWAEEAILPSRGAIFK